MGIRSSQKWKRNSKKNKTRGHNKKYLIIAIDANFKLKIQIKYV